MSEQPPTPRTESVSYILKQLRASIGEGASVTVGGMLKLFGVRGFAVLLMVLALFNVVIFMIPGISFLLGLPMVILAMHGLRFEWMFGLQDVTPERIERVRSMLAWCVEAATVHGEVEHRDSGSEGSGSAARALGATSNGSSQVS